MDEEENFTIYVFGLFKNSPGKTTLSTALIRGLVNAGMEIVPIKPRSGHNLWYQYNAFKRCLDEGRLYCEDIIKLRKASECHIPYEVLNPVDTLVSPMDISPYLKDRIREMYLKEKDDFSRFVVERYTREMNGSLEHVLCLNAGNRGLPLDIEGIENNSQRVHRVNNLSEWNKIFGRYAPRAITSCVNRLREECNILLVESFSDEVFLVPNLKYDTVLGVAPGVVVMYHPKDFQKVMEHLTKGKILSTIKARKMLPFLKPICVKAIPPLMEEELSDYNHVADKFSVIKEMIIKNMKGRQNQDKNFTTVLREI
jgi:predicted P-loop ATPase/GTPase